MQTALHIGGGKVTLSHSDSPVVLTPEEIPFIPGSSFKGALRSTVEKLVPGLPGLYSCGLIELSDEEIEERKKNKIPVCPTVRQRDIQKRRRNASQKELYDFEVVPASAVFNLEITVENATPQDLQILCVGLSEFVHGFGAIGGKRSRGLGACLLQDLKVSSLELTGVSESERNKRLRDYLLKRQFSDEFSGPAFLEKHINTIFV